MNDAETQTTAVDFDADGLVPVVAQAADSREVLMVAYATREALAHTLDTGRAHYYSRSREELWEKGATSGHTQSVTEVRVDCDADTVLYLVDQTGGACHTGHESCFHRRVIDTTAASDTGDAGDAGDTGEGDVDATGDDDTDATGSDDDTYEPFTVAVETVGERVFDPDEVY